MLDFRQQSGKFPVPVRIRKYLKHPFLQSVSFHENGLRHRQAVENRLYEIKRKGRKDELKSNMEKKWLEEIEHKAMNDYRSKDLGNNADITAQIFNQKRAEREENEAEESSDRARKAAQLAALEAQMQPQTSGKNGPMVGPQIDAPSSWLKTIKAPTSGTKWHNEPGTKKWYEAKSDEGYTYYWHVETNQSVWEPPAEGYVSLREQNQPAQSANPLNPEDIVSPEVAQQRAAKKAHEAFIQSKMKGKKLGSGKSSSKKSSIPDESRTAGSQVSVGPVAKSEPYGAWQSVPSQPAISAPVDYQVPQVKEAPQANVTMHSDRLTKFEEKKTPSLGGATTSSNKPAIVFRKRKINEDHKKNARRRDDE